MLIREALLADIEQLLLIEELSFDNPWSREAFEEEVEREDVGVGMVAEDEGLVVGYLTGMTVVDEFHLHNLAVHPDFRGRGIGRRLLDAAESLCKQRDLKRMILEVREDNEIARHLYQAAGFEFLSVRKDYYGPGRDANLYTKQVESE